MNPSPSKETPYNFSVGIADFTLRVQCNHHHLAETLRDRYADFQPRQAPALTAQVEWVGEERISSLLDTQTKFLDGILRLSAPGYQGFINEKTGRGHLLLSSTQPVEDIDYFLRLALALLVHQSGGVLIHAAGIVRNRQAYLFFGHSGSGKTTVCKASTNVASTNDCLILNDDLIVLLSQGKRWLAYGTPFWNPTQIKPSNQSAPLAGVYLLLQDSQVYAQELASGKAIAALVSNVPVIPQDPVRTVKLLEVLTRLQKNSKVFELHFLPDNSFWDVISN